MKYIIIDLGDITVGNPGEIYTFGMLSVSLQYTVIDGISGRFVMGDYALSQHDYFEDKDSLYLFFV